jgi:hypothetical protein
MATFDDGGSMHDVKEHDLGVQLPDRVGEVPRRIARAQRLPHSPHSILVGEILHSSLILHNLSLRSYYGLFMLGVQSMSAEHFVEWWRRRERNPCARLSFGVAKEILKKICAFNIDK